MTVNGYGHPLYATSLAEFGEPHELPCSGGWLLVRPVPGFQDHDAMGCYPIFSAGNWPGLARDFAGIGTRLISAALVADPFGDYAPGDLELWFDRVRPFKTHHVVDFSKPICVSKHHRYYSRKACGMVTVEVGPPPQGFAAEWNSLYGQLVHRRSLRGIKAFSRRSFESQMRVPGMVVFRGYKGGSLLGAHLWFLHNNVAYSHLAASTENGYALNCSYAIHSAVIEYFRDKARCVSLGAGAGSVARNDGLSQFKAGWSNATVPVFFCGKVFNPERYKALTERSQVGRCDYFPAYRDGELGCGDENQ